MKLIWLRSSTLMRVNAKMVSTKINPLKNLKTLVKLKLYGKIARRM